MKILGRFTWILPHLENTVSMLQENGFPLKFLSSQTCLAFFFRNQEPQLHKHRIDFLVK